MTPASSPTASVGLPSRPAHGAAVSVAELATLVGAALRAGSGQLVRGVTNRAAEVRPGDLFAALPGARVHGADFTGAALAAGAVAILTDVEGLVRGGIGDRAPDGSGSPAVLIHPRPREVLGALSAAVYGEPTSALRVLGVTGTSGKTTVAHLLEAGLDEAGRRTGLLGTVGTRIGKENLPSSLTTPEAPDLQALFALMRERGVSDVAMEVSSHALAMGRVAGTRFAVGGFTNLSQDHLDFHRDMADYFAAKARLFTDPQLRAERGVVCVDDEWGARLAELVPDAVPVSTGRTAPAHAGWRSADLVTEPDGTQRFVAVTPAGERVPVRLRLPGAYNVANALLALAMLDAAGVPATVAAPRFARQAVPGRMQRVVAGQPFLAVVDYAHKPAAVAALLDALRAQLGGRGKLITVLGCGGDRDTGKRPLMGAAAAARSDLLIVTDDNPRTEDPAEIRAAMLAGARAEQPRGDVLEIGDRRAAIVTAVEAARPGDAVVVAGKGHETGQEIQGVRHPFDDVVELTAAIRGIPAG